MTWRAVRWGTNGRVGEMARSSWNQLSWRSMTLQQVAGARHPATACLESCGAPGASQPTKLTIQSFWLTQLELSECPSVVSFTLKGCGVALVACGQCTVLAIDVTVACIPRLVQPFSVATSKSHKHVCLAFVEQMSTRHF